MGTNQKGRTLPLRSHLQSSQNGHLKEDIVFFEDLTLRQPTFEVIVQTSFIIVRNKGTPQSGIPDPGARGLRVSSLRRVCEHGLSVLLIVQVSKSQICTGSVYTFVLTDFGTHTVPGQTSRSPPTPVRVQ